MYIFISHSSKDAVIAQDLCQVIESNGSKCFIAPRDIRTGYEYAAEIVNGIDKSDAMLLILSKEANESPHILREIERAVTKSIPIMVYKLEEVVLSKSMEYFLMTHQWMNAKLGDYEDVIKCIENLKESITLASGDKTDNISKNADTSADIKSTEETAPSSRKKIPLAAKVLTPVIVAAVIVAGIIIFKFAKDNDTSDNSSGNITAQNNSKDSADEKINSDKDTKSSDIKLGDTVVFGKYNDADISWRVLKISDDNTQAILVSKNVLTMKAYDTAESGKFNYDGEESYYAQESAADTDMELQAYVRGNSSWETSNIRTWLNSSDENVKYEGQPPVAEAMADYKNGYNNEPGFLCGFTDEELAAIKETTVETHGNALSDANTITTTDKVFLLSMDELEWFDTANVSLLAEPTPEAIEQDGSTYYRDYCLGFDVKAQIWWLREPVPGTSSQCYLVGNGYYEDNIYTWNVGVESFGIRPAITVDLTADCIRAE